MITAHTTSLHIHEIALYIHHNIDEFSMPFHEESVGSSRRSLTIANASHLTAISDCITAAHATLDAFLKLSLAQLLTFPVPFCKLPA